MKDKWEFYKDTEGFWRWRRTAPNGNIIGASTQAYKNKTKCTSQWMEGLIFNLSPDSLH